MQNLFPEDRNWIEFTPQYARNIGKFIFAFSWIIILLDGMASVTGIWGALLYALPSKNPWWSAIAITIGLVVACLCFIITKHEVMRLSEQNARRHAEFRKEVKGDLHFKDFANLFHSTSFLVCFGYMFGTDTIGILTLAQLFGMDTLDIVHKAIVWGISIVIALLLVFTVLMGDIIGQSFLRFADFIDGEEGKYRERYKDYGKSAIIHPPSPKLEPLPPNPNKRMF